MNIRPEQIELYRQRLCDRPRVERIFTVTQISEHSSEAWAQELLCLGLADTAPDIAELCADTLCEVTPTGTAISHMLNELDSGDRIAGGCAERIFRNWAMQAPGLIRVLMIRGLNRRTLRVLTEVVARVAPSTHPLHVAAFINAAASIPAEVFRLQQADYDSSILSLDLMARVLAFIRSDRKLVDLYIRTLAKGPIFWLSNEMLRTVLTELQALIETHDLSHQLIQLSANKAIKQGNGGFLKAILPVLVHQSSYAARNAMLLAEIAQGDESSESEMASAGIYATQKIRLYGDVLIPKYRLALAQSPEDVQIHRVFKALSAIGMRARAALPEITSILRQAKSEHLQLAAITAIKVIGFPASSETQSVLTLFTISSSEEVQKAAMETLQRWFKGEVAKPAPANAAQTESPKLKNPPMSLVESCFVLIGVRPQGCFSGG